MPGASSMPGEDRAINDGSSSEKPRSIIWSVCIFILLVEMCERLAFYTFSTTLVLFFIKDLGADGTFATQVTSLFNALVYFTPLIGGYVGDEVMNRWKTILIFTCIYIVGLAMVTGASYPSTLNENVVLIGLLLFISLGAGGIKANVVTLGGDQFNDNDPEQLRQRGQFFNYFYASINIGAFIANGYLNNLAFNPEVFSGGVVPSADGYFVSYAIPLGVLILALMFFLIGTPRYKIKEPEGNPTTDFLRVARNTIWRSSWEGKTVILSVFALATSAILTITSYFVKGSTDKQTEDMQKYINVASMALIVAASFAFVAVCRSTEWLDNVRTTDVSGFAYDSKSLENVHDFLLLLPYFGFLTVFFLCYIQMNTNFLLQGCQMYNLIGGVAFSPSFFSIFDTISILVAVPICDMLLYPAIESRLGKRLRPLDKMWVGFVMVIIAMASAGIIEVFRKNSGAASPYVAYTGGNTTELSDGVAGCCADCDYWSGDPDDSCTVACADMFVRDSSDDKITAASETCKFNSACASGQIMPLSDMTIFWQIIPYFMVGFGEVFAVVSAYDLFYNEVDSSMRSVGQGVNLLTTTYGSFACGGLNGIFMSWMPTDLNSPSAHLDYVYFIIVGITVFALAALLVVYPNHVYRDERNADGINASKIAYGDDLLVSTSGKIQRRKGLHGAYSNSSAAFCSTGVII